MAMSNPKNLKELKKNFNSHCNDAVKTANTAKATLNDMANQYRKMTDTTKQ